MRTTKFFVVAPSEAHVESTANCRSLVFTAVRVSGERPAVIVIDCSARPKTCAVRRACWSFAKSMDSRLVVP